MQVSQAEMFAVKFAECMHTLRRLGLKGEVAVTAGVVMVSTTDKFSAPTFRKAIKTACAKTGASFVETLPTTRAYVFAVQA